MVARGARKQGVSVVAVGVKGDTSASLKGLVDKLHWVPLSQLDRMAGFFKDEGVSEVIMAGQISPWRLFSKEVQESPEIQQVLARIKDKRANSIFAALAERLESQGLALIDSTAFVREYIPGPGQLTKRGPTQSEWEDIHFGMDLAHKVAALDIGLSVAVKQKAILAVEALEGTDNLIRRAGTLSSGGAVIAKAARPDQDMRFDIPVIGLATVQTLIRTKGCCLAIEANKTLFIDMEETLALADRYGKVIVAV